MLFFDMSYISASFYRPSLRYDNVNALSVHSFSLMEVQTPSWACLGLSVPHNVVLTNL